MSSSPQLHPDDHDLVEPVVLVTAFGPFPGQPTNPTELIVDELAGEEHVVGHVLDVSYRRAPELLDGLLGLCDPAAVVCFGVAAGSDAVRIETRAAREVTADGPDVDDERWAGRQLDDGPEGVATRLPVDELVEVLEAARVPVERSIDAGGYVCNAVFRHVVTSPALLDRPAGFVHVPALGTAGFDAARLAMVGRLVVDTVAAHARGVL